MKKALDIKKKRCFVVEILYQNNNRPNSCVAAHLGLVDDRSVWLLLASNGDRDQFLCYGKLSNSGTMDEICHVVFVVPNCIEARSRHQNSALVSQRLIEAARTA